ncbi:MAG: 1-(5-phosphoribosyl)-5-[(5-phosphoribosylamino)methylideneamino]imidazole-4-carboxamide isomerase [Bacillota bacterium]
MLVIPAVDIYNGKCSRLFQGQAGTEIVYDEDPVRAAALFADMGAPMLHVIDLDGAFSGQPRNASVIEKIVRTLCIPVRVGGGIRTAASARFYLEAGADAVILGTAAFSDPGVVSSVIETDGADRVMVSVDVSRGEVVVKGWTSGAGTDALQALAWVSEMGVTRCLVTHVERDGTMSGPDFAFVQGVCQGPVRVVLAGGIASLDDIERMASLGLEKLEGVVVGRALYEGRLYPGLLWGCNVADKEGNSVS